ncbi:hypothetical protein PP101_03 [Pectobacterium phage PP101]|uniref:Uncharacterized protein n=1 Tax=Pectobacterium phage PP101 TaxID=1916414 RepID=A0A1J0MES2_9CAUD|nr:hypothetical protein HOR42_gp03 [Pectobacterium phage PP101]APD19671.1 hypothetical protein PP101_03 [Pectobacterium phage PP101]
MMLISFCWVDSEEVEQEKEFDSLQDAQSWLQGHREEDFLWIDICNEDGDILAVSFAGILELK